MLVAAACSCMQCLPGPAARLALDADRCCVVCAMQCIPAEWGAPHTHRQAGSGGSRTGGRPAGGCSLSTLWLLMLRGREYSAAVQGRMHATPLWPIYGPGRPPLYLCFRLASHGGTGSTLCPTLCCCLLAPTALRLDQPARAIGQGWKQAGEVQERVHA